MSSEPCLDSPMPTSEMHIMTTRRNHGSPSGSRQRRNQFVRLQISGQLFVSVLTEHVSSLDENYLHHQMVHRIYGVVCRRSLLIRDGDASCSTDKGLSNWIFEPRQNDNHRFNYSDSFCHVIIEICTFSTTSKHK